MKNLKLHVMNKSTNIFLFRLTYNIQCQFKNEFNKSFKIVFSL
jgi:hypothetical protein